VSRFGVPFRIAKIAVEKAVKYSKDAGIVTYPALTRALKGEKVRIKLSAAQIVQWQTPEGMLAAAVSFGGPGRKSLAESAKRLAKEMSEAKATLQDYKQQTVQARASLAEEIKNFIIKT